jgi:hypothetical protein
MTDQHSRAPVRSYCVSRSSILLQDPFDRETGKQPISCLQLAALQIALPVKRAALHSGKSTDAFARDATALLRCFYRCRESLTRGSAAEILALVRAQIQFYSYE